VNRTIRNLLGVCLLLGVVAAGAGIYHYKTTLEMPIALGNDVFAVSRGDSLSSITNDLVSRGVLKEPYTVRIYSRLNDTGSNIQAGEYRFPESITIPQLIDWLSSGKGQVGMKVTIIEGWNFRQMREAIASAPKLEKKTTGWDDARLMQELGHPDLHPEGQFYPDTYVYRLGDSDLTLYRKAFGIMQEKLELAWQMRKPEIELTTPYEALIMASIVEKESQVADELNEISGVFNNRLRKGMRLQTDPTVIYGVGEEYDGDITRKHLKTDTPYNTYTRHGLPPTPISLPAYPALLAAVQPSETKSLYFVASGGGRHKFSKTLEEHNAAVKKYILGQ